MLHQHPTANKNTHRHFQFLLVGGLCMALVGSWPDVLRAQVEHKPQETTRVYAVENLRASEARTSLHRAMGELADMTTSVDQDKNLVIVTAPEHVQTSVAQILGRLDAAPAAGSAAKSEASAPFVHSYRVTQQDEATIAQLQQQFAGEPEFRQIHDRPTSQWIVVAPAPIHDTIVQRLQATDRGHDRTAQGDGNATVPAAHGTSLRLKNLTSQTLHAKLVRAYRRNLPQVRDSSGAWTATRLDREGEQPLAVWTNDSTGETRIAASPAEAEAWRKMLTALDQSQSKPAEAAAVVRSEKSASPKVRDAVQMLGKSLPKARTVQFQGQTNQQVIEDDEEMDDEDLPEAPPQTGSLSVEFVEGTDIIMLRGTPEDVQRALEIIEDIERMQAIREPLVEVVHLEHVESGALATLLQQVTDELTEEYGYGTVLTVPLMRPNAVLLIGLPTPVEKAKSILEQLDQPGKTLTQFEVFRMAHANATVAQEMVENLFTAEEVADRPTLGPRALVIADPRLNSLIVRASPRDMDEVRLLVKEIDRDASDTVNELRVFKLRNSLAADLQEVLQAVTTPAVNADEQATLSRLLRMVTIDPQGRRSLESGVLAGSRINAVNSANALIVATTPQSMPLMETLISQLDQPPDAAIELKIFTLENADAVSLATTLNELFVTGVDPTTSPGGGVAGMRIEVDERTNSVVAAGSPEDLLVIEAIILRLDSTNARDRQNHVYRLNNKPADQVAFAINEWLRAEREVQAVAPGILSPFHQVEREVVVVPEMASNSLLVSATPKYYEEIARIIKEIDEEEPMVMVQVLIGEVTLGEADEFGVELGLQDSVLFDRSLLGDLETTTTTTSTTEPGGATVQVQQEVVQAATNTPGFNWGNASTPLGNSGSDTSLNTAGNVAAQGLASFAMQRVSPDLGFGGLVLSASSDSVSMLLRALQESRRMEILSRPQIMALNNQPGRAFVGQVVPFITSSTFTQFGQQNAVEFREVGLNLIVTPRISREGLVVMNVTAIKSELGSVAAGVPVAISADGQAINAPIIDQIEAMTTISATSGQTVVLSGLLTKQERALHRRVPILADVPLLGNLFRFDSTQIVRSELLIILTPHVVNNRFEAEMIKQVESARMNWCLSDVVDLNGPVGLRSRQDPLGEIEAQTIYPEELPAGRIPPEMLDSLEEGEIILPGSITTEESFEGRTQSYHAPAEEKQAKKASKFGWPFSKTTK